MVLTIEEYRAILKDHKSTDEQIKKRIEYIEVLCRGIIRQELEHHEKQTTKNPN